MLVDVYFNIHKGCLSVRSREKGKNYGRVVRHTDSILLKDCKFVVSEAGRQRVLRQRRKNVHAVVRGETFIPKYGTYALRNRIKLALDNPIIVSYNPYSNDQFVDIETLEPIFEAEIVIINGKDIAAFNNCGV